MKQIFRIFTLIAVAMLTAGQAWAGTSFGKISCSYSDSDGGELRFYTDAECSTTKEILLLGTSDALSVGTVYIKATPALGYKLGATDNDDKVTFITAEVTAGTSVAGARTRSGETIEVGDFIDVTATATKGVYMITMPEDGDLNVTFSVTFPVNETITVNYIDPTKTGNEQNCQVEALPLTGFETEIPEGWYVVEAAEPVNYNGTLTIPSDNDVNIILANGATMDFGSEYNRLAENGIFMNSGATLTIYGQGGSLEEQGSLNVYTYPESYFPSISTNGFSIFGGNVTTTKGISGQGELTIRGGSYTDTSTDYSVNVSTINIYDGKVTTTGGLSSNDEGNGITISGGEVNVNQLVTDNESVTISGGQVTLNDGNYAIYSKENITLGWTNDDDFIKATGGYSCGENCTLSIVPDKRFYVCTLANGSDPETVVAVIGGTAGTDGYTKDDIAGKTLKPLDGYYVATVNSHVIFNGKTDTDGKIKPDFSIDGTHYYTYNKNAAVTLSGGEDGVKVDVSGLPSGTTYDADNSTFTMPDEDVTLTLSRYMANVDYMDWDATGAQLVKKNTGSDNNTANNKVYILEGYEKKIGQDKEETWYICNTPASNNSGKGLEYSSATIRDFAGILLEGNVHLILANGSKMSVSDEDNVSGSATIDGHAGGSTIQGQSVAIGGFTIHGQGGTTEGILDVISTNSVQNAKGISYSYDDINICGGNINIVAHATGDNCDAFGIYAEFCDLNIYGGTVNVRSWDDKSAGSCGLIACYDDEHGGGNVNILGGTVNVITSDKTYTENHTTYAIFAKKGNVTISNATVTTFGVYANEVNGNTTLVTSSPPRYGIYAVSGELDGCGKVIITGNANIDAVGETGIGAEKLVQINSGTVSATRISSAGDIEINGGQVDSHTTIINMERVDSNETIDPNNTDSELYYPGDAIHADGSIILGWTAATDYVRAYRISTGPAVGEEPAVVKTADGKRFVAYHVDDSDTDNPVETPAAYLAGNTTLTDAELANINAPVCYKVFRPVAAAVLTVPDNVSVVGKTADFSITTGEGEQAVTTHYYLYNATAQSPVTVTASYDGTDFVKLGGLPEGTTLNAVANQPNQRSFAMTNGDIVLTATAVTPEKADGDIVYNGSAQTPDFTDGTTAMTLGTDYSTAVTKGGEAVSGAINVGTDYAVTLTGLGQYVGTTAAYDFSIVQKEVAITADDVSVGTGVAYTGSALSPEVTVSYTEGETTTVLAATDFTVSYQKQTSTDPVAYENVSEVKGVGTYVAVVTAVNDGNYTFADVTSNPFEVGKPTLTVKANNISVVYGTSSPAYTATYTGFVEGDTKAVLGGTLSFASDYTSSSNAGKTFTITPSGLISDKYDISYQTGTLTVTNATMTGVSASGWSGEYDGNAHGITVTKPSGATVRYRTRSTGTYNLTKNPTFADVGNYTVYYQITKSNYNTVTGSKKVTISAANVAYSGGTIKLDQNGYDITLNEGTGSAKPLPVSGHIDDLDYSRKLTTPPVSDDGDAGDGEEDHTGDTVIDDKDANLYTVCLPFVPETTDEEGNDIEEVTYYTLSSVSGTTLNFTEVQNEDVAAFTPYLVAITGESDYTLSCKDVSFEAEERIITKTVQGDAGIFTFCGTLIGLTNEEAVACSKDVVTAGAIAEAVANAVAEAIAADEDATADPDRAAAIAEAVTAEVTPGITAEVNAAVEAAIAEGTVYETYILQTGATWGKMKSETAAQRKIYIPPFRAFIAGPDVEVPAEARKLDSSFSGNDDNGATGINSIRTIDRDGTERWYDLSGRRIASPGKGIYISNGKKTIKK